MYDMSISTPKQTTEQSFADLLDHYAYEHPRRGQILKGEILSVDRDQVMVDVGLKRDAIVPRQDLERLDKELLDSLEAGAAVLVYVMRPRDHDDHLIVSINKALQQADWDRAGGLLESGEVVEAEVIDFNRGGLVVRFGRLDGFVPQSHVVDIPRGASGEEFREAKASLIGETLHLRVIEVAQQRSRLILSERKAQHAARQARIASLEMGQVITGRVVNIVDYGAFVDIGGVDGLIHISKLARRYVDHPSDVVSVDDEVTVQVDKVDVDRERVSLNRAVLMPDPWDTITEHLQIGDLVTGAVTHLVEYGALVVLPQGVEGLVHQSEMANYDAFQQGDLLRKGDQLLARVVDIDPAQKRLGLSIDAVTAEEQENWLHERMDEADRQAETPSDAVAAS